MKHSKVAAGTAAIVASILALSACSSPAGDKSDADTISLMAAAYSDGTQAYWEGLIKDFEEANPGKKVDLSVVSWNDYDQKVTTLLANKQQPDLLNYNTWSGYAASDLLLPVEDVTSPELRDDFLTTFTDNNSLDGTAYALPFIASARALYYNKSIFAEAGIAEPPTTWAEFEDDAKKITDAGYIGYGLPLGTEEAQSEFGLWAYNGGGDWQSDGKWTIDSDANVATGEFLNQLVKDGVTQDNPWATNRTDGAWQPFADGRVGMVFGFPGTFGEILDDAGMTDEDYGIAALPTKTEDIPSTTLGVQDVLVAFKSETDKTETLKAFLDFFYQQESYTRFLTEEGFLPTTKSASDALADDPKLGTYIGLLPDAKFAPTSDPAWTTVAGDIKQSIGEIAKPDADISAILSQLQQDAETAK